MKDNFSKQAELYAKYRPEYPQDLFDYILSNVKERQTAWDCATGNGQTAKELAKYFTDIYATDISQKQIDNAHIAPNIHYTIQPAEQTDFADDTFDLITVSQALHWFQFDKFFAEVKRVIKPGGYLAAWMYAGIRITPDINNLIKKHHSDTLAEFWDKERKLVDDNYAGIIFPFEEMKTPLFRIEYKWTLAELEGYLHTWSALQKFIKEKNYNPVDDLIKEISAFWTEEKMTIFFPVYLRMAKIVK